MTSTLQGHAKKAHSRFQISGCLIEHPDVALGYYLAQEPEFRVPIFLYLSPYLSSQAGETGQKISVAMP